MATAACQESKSTSRAASPYEKHRAAHGGAITAALILQEFVDNVPWAHLDIAGPAFRPESDSALVQGRHRFGVRTLLKFCRHYNVQFKFIRRNHG